MDTITAGTITSEAGPEYCSRRSLEPECDQPNGLGVPSMVPSPGSTHATTVPLHAVEQDGERPTGHEHRLSSEECSTESDAGILDSPHFSFVHFSIPSHARDFENSTNVALIVCQKQVLRPYLKFLFVVGWVPAYESASTCLQRFVNVLHPVLILIPFLLHYCIVYATCFWRGQITKHFFMPTVAPPLVNGTNESSPMMPIFGKCTHSVVQQYIPDVTHVVAYFYSFYALRFAEVEHLPTLIERVFIQTARSEMGFRSQRKLILKLRLLLYCALCWVVLSLLAQVLHVYDQYPYIRFSWLSPVCQTSHARIIWLLLMLTGFSIADTVYMAVIINYCVQCLLLVQYIRTITEKTMDRRITLDGAIKEITLLKSHLRILNHRAGIALSLMLINFGNLCVQGTKELLSADPDHHSKLIYASVGMAVVLWWISILLPITIAGYLCAKCRRLRMLGHLARGRPFGFEDVPLEELDSFILYVSSLNLTSKIFLIPVNAQNILIACVILIIILFKNGWLTT